MSLYFVLFAGNIAIYPLTLALVWYVLVGVFALETALISPVLPRKVVTLDPPSPPAVPPAIRHRVCCALCALYGLGFAGVVMWGVSRSWGARECPKTGMHMDGNILLSSTLPVNNHTPGSERRRKHLRMVKHKKGVPGRFLLDHENRP